MYCFIQTSWYSKPDSLVNLKRKMLRNFHEFHEIFRIIPYSNFQHFSISATCATVVSSQLPTTAVLSYFYHIPSHTHTSQVKYKSGHNANLEWVWFSVGQLRGDAEVLEEVQQELERGSSLWHLLPASHHHVVDLVWEGHRRWFGHAVASFECRNHVPGVHARVGHLAVGEDFHQQDSKGPHVRFDCEFVIHNSLGRSPLYRETTT